MEMWSLAEGWCVLEGIVAVRRMQRFGGWPTWRNEGNPTVESAKLRDISD